MTSNNLNDHPFILSLWDELNDSERAYMKKMRELVPTFPSRLAVMDPDGNVIPCDMTTLLIWQIKHPNSVVVAKTRIGDAEVSTVFLPQDHSDRKDSPRIHFETMIFGGSRSDGRVKASSMVEAKRNHETICQMLRRDRKGNDVR